MATSETSERSLEAQLEMLRSVNTASSAERIQDGILQRARWQRRQVITASLGAVVSAIGTFHFVLQRDPFGYFALTLTTLVLVFAAWRSAHRAISLVALLFGAMTAWVVWRTGVLHYKPALFLLTSTGIFVFTAFQYLVVRPSLQRELDMLGQDV